MINTKLEESNTVSAYIAEELEAKYDLRTGGSIVDPVKIPITKCENITSYKSLSKRKDTNFTKACKFLFLKTNKHFRTLAYMRAVYYKHMLVTFGDTDEVGGANTRKSRNKLAKRKLAKILDYSPPMLCKEINSVKAIIEDELGFIEKLDLDTRDFCKVLFFDKNNKIKHIRDFESEVLKYMLVYYGNNVLDVLKNLNISYTKLVKSVPEIKAKKEIKQ